MSTKFDLIVKSEIITSDKPTKPIEARPSNNPHIPDRIQGFLQDGTPVMVAKRPGKGGIEFNKFFSGKIYAVSADGFSAIMEKDDKGKKSNTQKEEEGMKLYSSSGFYLLSSKDYPSLKCFKAYTRLSSDGSLIYSIPETNININDLTLQAGESLEKVESIVLAKLDDSLNLVAPFNADVNKKRKRAITTAQETAEDDGEDYTGAKYTELEVSKKDGTPFVLILCKTAAGVNQFLVSRRREKPSADGKHTNIEMLSALDALEEFKGSKQYANLLARVSQGAELKIIQGWLMRSSVSFKGKIDLVREKEPDFGASVYIHSALKGWTKAICTMMYSKHPKFPQEDYEHNSYVMACLQAEIGINRQGKKQTPEGEKDAWSNPMAISYTPEDLYQILK